MTKTTVWPEGFHSAMVLTFDLDAEEVWIADEQAAQQPAVLSMGTFGPRVALPRILRLLQSCEIAATFFVPGRVAETHPACIPSILEGGHEVALHGYTHRSPASLTIDEERDELTRGLGALRAQGATVVGYRAPSWDVSEHTLGLVAELGLQYSSNFMDAYVPYRHEPSGLVELPVHWILDDAPHFWFSGESWSKTIRSAREVSEIWTEEAAGIAREGGLVNWTFHPQIVGRPGRMTLLESLLGAAVHDRSSWVARARDVATHVQQSAAHFATYKAGSSEPAGEA